MSGIERFERFHWLHEHYADIASLTDIGALSDFERWDLLWNHLQPVSYLVGPRNLDALDGLANHEKTELLNWLGIQHSRKSARKLGDKMAISHRAIRL